jgi:hypothetical protein
MAEDQPHPDPIDAHRDLQKAALQLARYPDYGSAEQYFEAIDRLEDKLRVVRSR